MGEAVSRRGLMGRAGRAGGGVAAAALVGTGPHRAIRPAAAQEDRGAAWAAAWSSGDGAEVAAVFAPDAIYHDTATGEIVQGSEAIRAWAQAYFDELTTVTQSVGNWYPIDGGGVAEWSVTATHAASGASVAYLGASVLLFTDGLITNEAAYYDLASYYTQIGEVCGPAMDGTPEATPGA